MNRRKSRETAMKILYAILISNDTVEDAIDNYKMASDEKTDNLDFRYIKDILNGTTEKAKELDAKIEENLKNWKLNRVSKMSLVIMRIAIYEILYVEDVPSKVAVNEAVELSKMYCEDNAPKFINGVLGNLL